MKKLGLLPRLILGIILGIVIGNLNLPSIVEFWQHSTLSLVIF